MKTLIVAVSLLLIRNTLIAQKNFEGKIVYRLTSASDNSKSIEQVLYLKEDKIFIDFGNKAEAPNSLYDFTRGIEYKFVDDSTVVTNKLTLNILPYSSKAETGADSVIEIQNYICHKKVSVIMAPMNQYFKSIENWFPENITFKTNLKANFVTPPVVYFNGQTISLKTKIRFTGDDIDTDIEAVDIKQIDIPDSVFTLPVTRKIMSITQYSSMLLEKFKSIDKSLGKDIELTQKKTTQDTPTPSTKSPAIKPKQ
jgi:hypothetical protein